MGILLNHTCNGSLRSISFKDIGYTGAQRAISSWVKCSLARQELGVDAQLLCYNDSILGVSTMGTNAH
jgi:hypothetical protein